MSEPKTELDELLAKVRGDAWAAAMQAAQAWRGLLTDGWRKGDE